MCESCNFSQKLCNTYDPKAFNLYHVANSHSHDSSVAQLSWLKYRK